MGGGAPGGRSAMARAGRRRAALGTRGAPGRNYSVCWAPMALPDERRYVVALPSRD